MFTKINLLIFCLITLTLASEPYVHHDLKVKLFPDQNRLEATDAVTLPADSLSTFLIHQDLEVTVLTDGVRLEKLASGVTAKDVGMDQEDHESSSGILLDRYRIQFNDQLKFPLQVELKYAGKINHPVQQLAEEYARGFSTSPGMIDTQGVYLAGATYWVPWFNVEFITFNLEVTVPADWDAVSQGRRAQHDKLDYHSFVRWESPEPMEEVFLIAAPFFEFSSTAGAVEVMAFLRSYDPNLANKYLETTAQYLEMYRELIGPFPFSKFALVENFWETGYGMPSFTLLGPRVIRFPFILHSSYPHELLHNWWGNSVYVDFSQGNWCEGITVYMADHLIKEQRGQGAEYRQSALQRFTDYVNEENDFPVKDFKSRYDAASAAIGYGKSMMMWEMLRNELGDDVFKKTFFIFNRDYRFKKASFDDIRKSAEETSGKSLKSFFKQWTTRKSAPELQLQNVEVQKGPDGYQLRLSLKQIQPEEAFELNIPVKVRFSDKEDVYAIRMNQKEQEFEITIDQQPLEVKIDPDFNVFRKLHYEEIPPALSKIFGAEKILIVLPAKAEKKQLDIYRGLAEKWSADKSRDIEIKMDSDVSTLPDNRAVWLFGYDNRFIDIIKEGMSGQDADITPDQIRLSKSSLKKIDHSFAIAVRHPGNVNSVSALLTIHDGKAVDGLARKLPHYGKYSYLAFEGDEPANVAKGQWTAVGSPLTKQLSEIPGGAEFKPIAPRQALAHLAPVFSGKRIMDHVRFLADVKLEGRGPGTEGSRTAAEYIAEKFKEFGLQPFDGESYYQEWQDVIDAEGKHGTLRNVIGVLPGKKPEYTGQSVVVCAHYDHLGRGWPDVRKGNEGKVHPGADDNASGVAVMLELAQLLAKSSQPDRTIIFIAFDGEENGLKGSQFYLKNSGKYPAEKVMGAINLDTVGRLFKQKVLVLNSQSAREWRFIFMGSGYVTGIESEMVTQDLDASDQTSFIQAGIPAVQIFSGPHEDYHRPSDTIAKIDKAGMVKIASFAREAVVHLAEREKPMNFAGSVKPSGGHPGTKADSGTRRASTGSMPDFSYKGMGVRIQQVSEDSPAAKSGLQAGDIIIKIDGQKVDNLKDYSNVLKQHQPGDEVGITFEREGKIIKVTIVLAER